jgi:hypothetical protein
MAVRFSASRAGGPLPPGRFLVLISIRGLVDPRHTSYIFRCINLKRRCLRNIEYLLIWPHDLNSTLKEIIMMLLNSLQRAEPLLRIQACSQKDTTFIPRYSNVSFVLCRSEYIKGIFSVCLSSCFIFETTEHIPIVCVWRRCQNADYTASNGILRLKYVWGCVIIRDQCRSLHHP